MDLGIQDKVAIITGASSGIGEAVALALAQNGARVAIVARTAKTLAGAAERIRGATGADVLDLAADVSSPDTPADVVAQCAARFGSVDILVNNAGRAHAGGLMAAEEDDWRDMTETKLFAMRRFCKCAIPLMRGAGWGRIVNMSSIGGIYANPKLLISHVLSAAINNLTKGLALEVARDGILVNAVGIGAVATDNWARNMVPAVRRNRPELGDLNENELIAKLGAEMTPIGRFGQPEEIAAVAAFLASAQNGFVTGATIEASGGADRFV